MKQKTIYLMVIVFFIKLIISNLNINQLKWFLLPVVETIQFLTEIKFDFVANHGFYNSEKNILIAKSCSGLNFLLICVTSFICILIYKNQYRHKLLIRAIALGLLGTYLANISRIYIAIIALDNPFYQFDSKGDFHHLEGTAVYLFYLLTFCAFFHFKTNFLSHKVLMS